MSGTLMRLANFFLSKHVHILWIKARALNSKTRRRRKCRCSIEMFGCVHLGLYGESISLADAPKNRYV